MERENWYLEDGYIVVKYEIQSITATFEEDNENEQGIVNCQSIDIGVEMGTPDDVRDSVKSSLEEKFIGVRYNDVGDDGFENEAAEDIAREAKVDPSLVDIERE